MKSKKQLIKGGVIIYGVLAIMTYLILCILENLNILNIADNSNLIIIITFGIPVILLVIALIKPLIGFIINLCCEAFIVFIIINIINEKMTGHIFFLIVAILAGLTGITTTINFYKRYKNKESDSDSSFEYTKEKSYKNAFLSYQEKIETANEICKEIDQMILNIKNNLQTLPQDYILEYNSLENEYNNFKEVNKVILMNISWSWGDTGNDVLNNITEIRNRFYVIRNTMYERQKENTTNQSTNNNENSPKEKNFFFNNVNSFEDAKARYKRLCLAYHPDNSGGDNEMFTRMDAEYHELCSKNGWE